MSSQTDLLDAEYSQLREQITWVDSTGSLWIARVDTSTGLFVPANGKGVLVDSDAMTSDDLEVIGNGPEWVSAAATDHVVYTKFLPGQPHTMEYARLALARQQKGGAWLYSFLSPLSRRNAPYASGDAGDRLPRLSYVDPQRRHYWRNLLDAQSETSVTAFPASFRSMRFAKGARAASFVAPVDGVSQVFRYWLDTQALEQLTFDEGQKDLHSVPWIWRAPEYDNAWVVLTLVDDVELRIYREPNVEGGAWSMIYSAVDPHGGMLNSPEPFTYGGRSYVCLAGTVPPRMYPATIFLSNIDSSDPMFAQLTPELPIRMRHDPEVFITDQGPYIYFNRFDPSVGEPNERPNCSECSEGVYRSYTGLAPL